MNHAVFPSLCLAVVVAASPVLYAQDVTPDTQAAIDAAVRRENKLMSVRNLIVQGRTFEAQRDILAASQAYNKALQGLREIGGVVEPERTDAVIGLAGTTLALA
ncbi:MAG TPA: hypothetical protein VK530_06835, partial [Candidatus Acidoferrum sp.]|nr:hypothetical protein [Candidatus Acidoferrum sp.]